MRFYKHDCYQSDDNKLWIKLVIRFFFFQVQKGKEHGRKQGRNEWRANLTLKYIRVQCEFTRERPSGQLQSHCGSTLQERVSMLLYNTGTECSSTSECQLSRLTHVINFTEYLLTLTKKKKQCWKSGADRFDLNGHRTLGKRVIWALLDAH